jgi:hypothetical protein
MGVLRVQAGPRRRPVLQSTSSSLGSRMLLSSPPVGDDDIKVTARICEQLNEIVPLGNAQTRPLSQSPHHSPTQIEISVDDPRNSLCKRLSHGEVNAV